MSYSKKVYRRIQAFKLIYKGWKYTDIAEFLNVTKETMSNWIKLYKKDGIKGLISLKYKGGLTLIRSE
jgi:transposase